ncbi:MAG: phosphate ABC transporter substrate-binding/OmpA family protein [Pyrinomonadaceae bacterium]|nr:phosphate ABC transporter substrate-binding/OmpA family protein [Pyrinomonadaceae bacterium]
MAIRIGNYKLGPGFIILALALILGLLYVAFSQFGLWDKLRPKTDVSKTEQTIERTEDIKRENLPATDVKPPTPTKDDPEVTIGIWTWQAQSALIDAVGGPGKSGDYPDSLLYQAGIKNTRLVVENDTSKQVEALASNNMQFVTTTGDQSAVDIAGANKLLRGPKAKVVWSGGYSSGEDCLMGPESWKKDPQNAKGALVVTAVPYCDFNVVVNWAADNKIPINPDEKVYNPDAINFVNAMDHIEASQKFIANAKVSLKNVKTGQQENREIDAVATWTPGDVMAVQGRSSVNFKGKSEKLQKIISTEQYSAMMPNILFTTEDFIKKHPEYIETLLRSLARAGAKIKKDPNYFKTRVAALNAQVFNMEGKGPSFWAKYFDVVEENGVRLGGSRVNDIADNRHLFGVGSNKPLADSVFGISYNSHAKRLQQLLPERMPQITPVDQVVDFSFIKKMSDEVGEIKTETGSSTQANSGDTVVKANFDIVFDSGSAELKPSEIAKLNEIRSLLIRASNTKVIVEGHTDNAGDSTKNIELSKARANSVWTWLKASDESRVNINDQRIITVDGYGSLNPIAGTKDTQTSEDKAKNRRVTIILK